MSDVHKGRAAWVRGETYIELDESTPHSLVMDVESGIRLGFVRVRWWESMRKIVGQGASRVEVEFAIAICIERWGVSPTVRCLEWPGQYREEAMA